MAADVTPPLLGHIPNQRPYLLSTILRGTLPPESSPQEPHQFLSRKDRKGDYTDREMLLFGILRLPDGDREIDGHVSQDSKKAHAF